MIIIRILKKSTGCFDYAMSWIIQNNMSEEKTVTNFEIYQLIKTFANSHVQNDALYFWKNMSTFVKLF